MKITVPPPQISETDGFLPRIDIFKRKPYAENLTNILVNTEDNMVTALDSAWGTGKSTFIQMWRGYLHQQEIKCIVFDAFSNDYQTDPFLAIVNQILHLVDDTNDDKKQDIKSKAVNVARIIGRAGFKVGLKAITLGALDGTELDDLDVDSAIADEVSDLADKYISSQLLSVEQDKQTILEFKNTLNSLPEALETEKPIIFIIDELDRCKPQFAVELLEKIKHIFDVPNIKFVLVINRPQIEEAIRGVYGQGVDAQKYLNKFISLWTTFPRTKQTNEINHKNYINRSLEQMNYPRENQEQEEAEKYFIAFSEHFDLTLREINHSLTHFAIAQNAKNHELNTGEQMLVSFLCVIKTRYPAVYRKLKNSEISYSELASLLDVETLKPEPSFNNEQQFHEIKYTLEFLLLSDSQYKRKFIEDYDDNVLFKHFSFNGGEIERVCNWLDLVNK